MQKMKTLTLGACMLASTLAPASAQETTLDYAKLSSYLNTAYPNRCKDNSTTARKSFYCIAAGSQYNPTSVEVTDSGKGAAYTLTIRVNDRDNVANFDKLYQNTVGAIPALKAEAPTVWNALRLCFDKSELGKNDRANCRYLPGNGMGLWGNAGDGFEFIVQTYKQAQ